MSNIVEEVLDDESVDDLNKILRQRDCYWASILASDPNFQVLDGKGIVDTVGFFSDCGQDTTSEFRYSHTNFLLFTMQKQLGCQGESSDLNDSEFPSPSHSQNTSTDEDGQNKTALYTLLSLFGVLLLLAFYMCVCMLYRKQYCIRKKATDSNDGFFKDSDDDDDIIKLPRMPFSDEIPNRPFPSPASSLATIEEDGVDTSSEVDKSTRHEKEAGSGWVTTRSIMTGIATTKFPRLAAKSHESSMGDLCKACKMVGIDPKCPFCQGGGTKQKKNSTLSSSPKSVMDEAIDFVGDGVDDLDDRDMMHLCTYCTSGFGTPSPDCATCSAGKLTVGNGYNDLNERWHGEARHQVVEPPEPEEDFQGRYEISEVASDAETRKEPRKSRAMSKLKELRGLKEAELL